MIKIFIYYQAQKGLNSVWLRCVPEKRL